MADGIDTDDPYLTAFLKHKNIQALNRGIVVGDTAYKTPAIAHLLKSKGIKLLSTYGRLKTKKGFFPKYEYVY